MPKWDLISAILISLVLNNAAFFISLPSVLRTPESQFANLLHLGYPWKPNYFDVNLDGFPALRMHYLDLGPVGARETILLLHGTPAWSFLYRKMIPVLLNAGYRIIAPDFIGFGRSDKLTDPNEYTHQLHVDSLLQLVHFLDLKDVTLFGQDLGGPTGLSVVRREKTRFKRLVLFNTWIPQGDIFSNIKFTIRHIPYLAWRFATLFLGRSVPIGLIFALVSEARLMGSHGYKAPFPDKHYKAGPSRWPLLVPLKPNEPMAIEMQAVKAFLESEWRGPVLFGYSSGELFTKPGGDLFRRLFQKTGCEVTVNGAGHFLQEDQGDLVSNIVINFINNGCTAFG